MRCQVGIIGAGPAGLLLGHLLHRAGIDAVVIESRSRRYIEGRIRAGLLEQGSVETLVEAGLGERLLREGLPHEGVELRHEGGSHRIELTRLTGKRVTIYGQQEVVKDLVAARLAAGLPLFFEVSGVRVEGIEGPRPAIHFTHADGTERLDCDIIAGCDGFHGITRDAIPPAALRILERVYPFAWLGILAEAKPASHELIYARHQDGFALATMRSESLSRLYLQCAPDEDPAAWPDARIWAALHRRLGPVPEGPIIQKGVTGMRSFVAEPMRFGSLFLAGDAAHIVPPTGAKGMNLAIADVRVLAAALDGFFRRGETRLMEEYSRICLARVWKVQRFSWWMTQMLHRFDAADGFEHHVQAAELDYLFSSEAAQKTLAENYVGLPYEGV
ncbi:4-hydroxybenzoate 3-monooxygenase [Rhodovarius lipocyclicus]|uniref:4-hydroxybenzoate 3-monooxygenase n=1 Tax=Rhodovarius lipocyclicus TaxID=268410 RepID=UPI00135AF575|nr:4-hydroxybenzoate 3-monooxygenase [Rhodovarius lipocyclicus]